MKRGLLALEEAMRALNVPTRNVFEAWLEKEKQFLRLLTKEPLQETQEMEYYQRLVNFYACE
jgi:homoserine trans-succinylase